MDAEAYAASTACGTLSASLDLRTRTLVRSASSAAPESEQPSLSRALCEHGAPKLLRVVESLVDLLVSIVSDTAEMAIASQF
jgi:hypothetical protein